MLWTYVAAFLHQQGSSNPGIVPEGQKFPALPEGQNFYVGQKFHDDNVVETTFPDTPVPSTPVTLPCTVRGCVKQACFGPHFRQESCDYHAVPTICNSDPRQALSSHCAVLPCSNTHIRPVSYESCVSSSFRDIQIAPTFCYAHDRKYFGSRVSEPHETHVGLTFFDKDVNATTGSRHVSSSSSSDVSMAITCREADALPPFFDTDDSQVLYQSSLKPTCCQSVASLSDAVNDVDYSDSGLVAESGNKKTFPLNDEPGQEGSDSRRGVDNSPLVINKKGDCFCSRNSPPDSHLSLNLCKQGCRLDDREGDVRHGQFSDILKRCVADGTRFSFHSPDSDVFPGTGEHFTGSGSHSAQHCIIAAVRSCSGFWCST